MFKKQPTYQPQHSTSGTESPINGLVRIAFKGLSKAIGFVIAAVAGEVVVQAFEPEIRTAALVLRSLICL